MAFGTYLAEGRKRQNLTQHDIATGVPCSRESISKYETGERPIPDDMYSPLLNSIDDPETYFHGWKETSGYVSIPYFDGEYINHQSLNMLHLVKKESEEAFTHLRNIPWEKPAQALTDIEREEAVQSMKEILDAAASMINLVAAFCKEYKFSMLDIFRAWHVSLKSRRLKR